VERVYLDNAATSWPKPEGVYAAMDEYFRNNGATAGRGGYAASLDAAAAIEAARRELARLIGADDFRRIVFTSGGTDSLNVALHGLLNKGDHVVATVCEHNSVLRPLRFLEEQRGIEVTYARCDAAGTVAAEEVLGLIRSDTRLVAVTHASNTTGAIQPVAEIAAAAKQHDSLLLVDAAQSAGQLPIDVQLLGVDLLAAPGHKGLLGPLGVGMLYVGPQAEPALRPFRQGGTGSQSDSVQQPDELPERFEAGNLNVPGILGLAAGVDYLMQRGVAAVREHHLELLEQLVAGLDAVEQVTIVGPQNAQRVGVLSFTVAGYAPQEVAALLESVYGIEVRAGYHCAAAIHEPLGTARMGGTVRISVGPFNTPADIEAVTAAVVEIAASPVVFSESKK
jgi:cysteine desulfurase family protein